MEKTEPVNRATYLQQTYVANKRSGTLPGRFGFMVGFTLHLINSLKISRIRVCNYLSEFNYDKPEGHISYYKKRKRGVQW